MVSTTIATFVILNHREDACEGNEENIEEVNESFISMEGNLVKENRKKSPKALIKYFLRDLGTSLKNLETCILFLK